MKSLTLRKIIGTTTLVACSTVSFVLASETSGTILSGSQYTRVCHDSACSTYGTLNFLPTVTATTTAIRITDTAITGYVWGNETGWINFAPNGAGVTVDAATGLVYGTAWSQAGGWINFRPSNSGTVVGGVPIGVSITSVGELYGYAWFGGVYGGWIKFDCSSVDTCVKTDYRTTSYRSATHQSFAPAFFASTSTPTVNEEVPVPPTVSTSSPVVEVLPTVKTPISILKPIATPLIPTIEETPLAPSAPEPVFTGASIFSSGGGSGESSKPSILSFFEAPAILSLGFGLNTESLGQTMISAFQNFKLEYKVISLDSVFNKNKDSSEIYNFKTRDIWPTVKSALTSVINLFKK